MKFCTWNSKQLIKLHLNCHRFVHALYLILVMSQGLSCLCPTDDVSWRDWNAAWGPSTGRKSRVESWELEISMVLKLAWQHWELKLIYIFASDALELLCFWVSVDNFFLDLNPVHCDEVWLWWLCVMRRATRAQAKKCEWNTDISRRPRKFNNFSALP